MPDTATYQIFTAWRISLVFALVSSVIGLTGLSGWLFGNEFLKSFLSDGATMKINTALLMIMGGVGLISYIKGYFGLARVLSVLVMLLSIAVLIEQLTGFNLHIDEFWMKDLATNARLEAPGRTSLLTALNALLAGLSLMMLTAKRYQTAQLFATCVFILVYFSLMGHLFHISGFYRLGRFSGIAFHTALALLFLAAGLLIAEPRRGWISTIYERLISQNLLVYVLSYFLGAAPLLAALYLFVIQKGDLSPASGIVVLITLSAIAILPVAYFLLRLIDRMGGDLRVANQELAAANEELAASIEELRVTNEDLVETNEKLVASRQEALQSEQILRIAMEAADFGTWHIDTQTRELIANARLKELFGFYPQENVTVAGCIAQITDDYREAVSTAIEHAIQDGGNYDITYTIVGFHDGHTRWVRAIGNLKVDQTGAYSAFTGIMMDITEQKADELRKNDFIGMVSHELKTPLTSLTSLVQVLQMKLKAFPDNFIPGAIQKADIQVRKMRTMINGFLNVSRLESGKILIDKRSFDLDQLLGELSKEAELISPGSIIRYSPCGPIMLKADRDKMESVISNLLSNAIKYSPKGSLVDVECHAGEHDVKVSIRDQGVGIRIEDQERIFKRYFRVESNAAHVSGFGIGLYLSAEIIYRHQGKIGVDSEIGKGSTFYFSLPIL
ncbi:sensor histidine kinase [Mucilaginibacter lacusdianchii]|uniref:sensor histidine kinase n=1 Tax=Mucilaginibacter lacusdianchii TaxID=2684211 RepID=UPI00131AF592|nr:ATP-binding protein [Mucilaginibacter sp. JXJ CY 39]